MTTVKPAPRKRRTYTEPVPFSSRATLLAAQKALGYDDTRMAAYVGANRRTWMNWAQGTREPPDVLMRLINVLQTVQTLAPAIHSYFEPEVKP